MRFRGKSIRRKIVALLLVPLVSLTAMWAFATYVTGTEARQLLKVAVVVDKVGYPTEEAVQALQKERRATLVYLADPRIAGSLTDLRRQTLATDRAVARLRANAQGSDVREDLLGSAGPRLQTAVEGFSRLDELRDQVENNTLTRREAFDRYNALVDPCYVFLGSMHFLPDANISKQGAALVALTRGREALSREDAVLSAALVSGSMSQRELRDFSDRVAERKVLYETSLSALPASERAVFEDYWNGDKPRELESFEDAVIAAGPSGATGAINAERWHATAQKVLGDLDRMDRAAGDRLGDRVQPAAMTVLVKAAFAGVLGFVALLASIIVSFRLGRRHVKDLGRLRKDAHEVSGVRLPSVMRRLAAGEQVDVETEAPRLEFTQDEMGQVAQALHTLQRAAVEAAVKQADMRRGVSEVFVNLARRSQVLLHRQLTLLDAMERRTEDTDELADLFRLDHLTTRMRRHAEGLVILSGAAPSRQWRKPIQLMDVVRAAVSEVEDYERIEVRRLPRLAVEGPAVSDLTHLIAELLENATVFSPPHTAVQVVGERVANGFTLEIHDRGLGMAPDALLDANLRLAETPEFELSDTDRLGLFVVSRLAQRQGVRVSLQPSPFGGTTAVVFIPGTLLTESPGGRTEGGRDEDTGTTLRRAAADAARGGALAALAQVPVPLPERGAPDAAERASEEDESVFRGPRRQRRTEEGRPALPTGPVPAERVEHQPAGEPSPGGGPAPLPRRRRSPVLVRDHGRPVEGEERPGARGDERPVEAAPSADKAPSTDKAPSAAETSPAAEAPSGQEAKPARTVPGLPRRVRQASLAPQLKTSSGRPSGAATEAADPAADRDAEDVRSRMASLQRGWQRGRRESGEDGSATAPRKNMGGDGR
ncbi:nitrate- and nitrite sensing domain-containing protein [Streptomyces violens]|uniref:nitrate- and nitrite sensing domain-containing protein n=1 Tax=Streptomyces violens TaxID=66377 RepID=UPI0004BE6EA9|nr:nitrate- and nitrite sensing domain-containing protein [Streptomyces violens]